MTVAGNTARVSGQGAVTCRRLGRRRQRLGQTRQVQWLTAIDDEGTITSRSQTPQRLPATPGAASSITG